MAMTYDRMTADNAEVLFVDHQTGLANGVETQTPADFINNVKALVTIAQIYKLPTIITTSAHDGPNCPIMPVVEQGLPNATTVHRPGEVNAFDTAGFWRMADLTLDAAFAGKTLDEATDKGEAFRHLGYWSDGRPVLPPIVGDDLTTIPRVFPPAGLKVFAWPAIRDSTVLKAGTPERR